MKERNPNYKYQKELLKSAWDFFNSNKLEQANEIIDKLNDTNNSYSDIYIDCLILQSRLLIRSGKDYKKGYDLASKAISLSEKEKNFNLIFEAKIALIASLLFQGTFESIPDLFLDLEKLLIDQKLSEQELLPKLATFYKLRAAFNTTSGKNQLAIEDNLKTIEIEQELSRTEDLIKTLSNLSTTYVYLGDLEKGKEYLFKAMDLALSNNSNNLYSIYSNLGSLFYNQGEFDQALEYLNKSLVISKKKSLIFTTIGEVFFAKGELDQAIHNFTLALDLFIQSGDNFHEVLVLVLLIRIYIENNEQSKISVCLEKIKTKYIDNPENDTIKTIYHYSNALILKQSERLVDRAEAQKIFHDIIAKEEYIESITVPALLNYIESLINELKQTGNESIIQEIEESNTKLTNLAKKMNSHSLMVESLLIEAKLSILRLEFNKARKLLTQAQISADEKGLNLLAQKISQEHDNLLNKIEQWESLVNEDYSLKELLEFSNIEDVLQNMIKKSINASDEKKDEGLIFLISNPAGISLYSKNFIQDATIDDTLVASLLTAINSFSQETFKTNESLERIKQGVYTLLFKNVRTLNFCYTFKGSSYYASQKMNKFTNEIQIDDSVIRDLENYGYPITDHAKKILDGLVDVIFVQNKV